MIYAFDTYYQGQNAKTACVGFQNWDDEKPSLELEETIAVPDEYESGSFYKRELPCILSILKKIGLQSDEILVVDGYVHLSDEGKKGLGGYLFEKLENKYPVIGVAKNLFSGIDIKMQAIERGESKKRLYITAQGEDLDTAAQNIKSMHGEYRMPTLLRCLDQLSRM